MDKWKERHTCVLARGQMVGTLHLCIGTWADGWNVTPVLFLVGSRGDGNAPVQRMCSARHIWSALYPTEEFVVSSLFSVRGMTVPVRHVQASTEACQTIECNLSFQICVILCRRLGSRNDLSSVTFEVWYVHSCRLQ